MIASFIAKKLRQTQLFDEKGRRWPVTILEAGPCPIVQVKSKEKDGYTAVQLGFGTTKRARKPQSGHATHARLKTTPRFLREVRLSENDSDLTVGNTITLDQIFAPGDDVSVSGTSKGKGWAGVVKRYHFRGGPATHGQSDRERAPGSIGGTTTPGRVYKGQRMAGRMGSDTVTVKGLKVMAIDLDKNLLTVSGLIPGSVKDIVIVSRLSEKQEVAQPAKEAAVPEEAKAPATAEKVEEAKAPEKPKETTEVKEVKKEVSSKSEKAKEEVKA